MLEIIPDIEFKKTLKKMSGAPLNECMQCGTCSVVCSLAPENKPFPRKEMILAGWGLKDRLLTDADIWLCHQCGDCSTHCPRGVRPADILAAMRVKSGKMASSCHSFSGADNCRHYFDGRYFSHTGRPCKLFPVFPACMAKRIFHTDYAYIIWNRHKGIINVLE